MKNLCLLLLLVLPLAASPLAETRRVTPPDFGEAKQPQLAIASGGTIHIAFGKATAIYTTRSEDNGASFSEPVKVAELPKLALGMRRGPRIATADNTVIIAAISHQDGNLYSWSSDDRGRSWSKPIQINTASKSAVEGLHGLASDPHGKVAAVWLDLRNGKTELWTSVSNDHGKTWAANTLAYRSPDQTICECCHPSIAFGASGEIIVMWRNWLNGSRDMYRAQSSDGGKTFSPATKIGTGTWKLQACPMDGGSLATDGDRVAYAWRRDRKLLATLNPQDETLLSESGTHPVVVRTEQGFGFLWQDQGNLYWKHPNQNEPALLARDAGFAHATPMRDAAKSLIVWEGRDGIYAKTLP